VPAVCTAVFFTRKQYGSAAVTLFWVGQNLADVAVYVADGRAMALPLLADGLIHDWNFILGRLGLLYRAEALGRLTFGLGAPALHPIPRALAQAQAVIGAELTIDLEGCPATFLVNTVPLRDAEGRLTGSVSVFHDVTGARQLERDAAEHAARLRTLVDLVNEG